MCLDCAYFCWNWKYCNEIIFKCVNSAVEPIFNRKMVEKCNLWDPWTVYVHCLQLAKSTIAGWTKKKKKRKTQRRNEKCKRHFHCNPNGHNMNNQLKNLKLLSFIFLDRSCILFQIKSFFNADEVLDFFFLLCNVV